MARDRRRFSLRIGYLEATELHFQEVAADLPYARAIVLAAACPVKAHVMRDATCAYTNMKPPAPSLAEVPQCRLP